jgi:L-fuculose-phosphate aldolase
VTGDDARVALVETSRRMVRDGLCIGTSGNLSVRAGDDIYVTPSGVQVDDLVPADICVVDPAGAVRSAPRRVTSELPLHLAVYAASDVAGAVVHTHSPYATALSTVTVELPAIHYTINALGGPVRVAPYATFGTPELAGHVRRAIDGRFAAILANHGTVAYAESLAEAYRRAELLEWLATLYWRACQIRAPAILTEAQLGAVREQARRTGYGDSLAP